MTDDKIMQFEDKQMNLLSPNSRNKKYTKNEQSVDLIPNLR